MNGSKTYITNGVEADVFMLYAKARENMSSSNLNFLRHPQLNGRITAFVVDRNSKGFSTSAAIDKV